MRMRHPRECDGEDKLDLRKAAKAVWPRERRVNGLVQTKTRKCSTPQRERGEACGAYRNGNGLSHKNYLALSATSRALES